MSAFLKPIQYLFFLAAPFVTPKDLAPVGTGTKYLDPQIIQIEDKGTVIKCPRGYKVGEDNSCIGKSFIIYFELMRF